MKRIAMGIIVLFACLAGCKHEIINPIDTGSRPDSTGTGIGGAICFESDVLPVFQSNCAKSGCHDVTSAEEEYVLDSYDNILKRGIKKGNAAESKLYKVLLETGGDRMPQPPSAPLATLQIQRIAQWINEGAKNTTGCNASCDTTRFAFSANVLPILRNYCTGCHNATTANGNVVLSTYDGVKTVTSSLPGVIQWLPGYKAMPQPGSKMPDCDIKVVLKWIKAGALNN